MVLFMNFSASVVFGQQHFRFHGGEGLEKDSLHNSDSHLLFCLEFSFINNGGLIKVLDFPVLLNLEL